MPDKNISPENEDAKATPQDSDDTKAQEPQGDAQDPFDVMIRGDHSPKEPQEEEEEESDEESDEESEDEQPTEEDSQEEFATFGSRTFKSKDDLMDYVKKVHGDNSRLVGDIRRLESKVSEFEEASKSQPQTQGEQRQLSESEVAMQEAKRTLQKTLEEMGYVTQEQINERINPIIEERLETQTKELAEFIDNEAKDFWDYEQQIMALDGQINPTTNRPYTAREAYKVVKYLADPESVISSATSKKEAKKKEAAKKQAAMGTAKSVSKPEGEKPKGNIMDTLMGLRT